MTNTLKQHVKYISKQIISFVLDGNFELQLSKGSTALSWFISFIKEGHTVVFTAISVTQNYIRTSLKNMHILIF